MSGQFLEAARQAGPQAAAFYAFALETGLSKAELVGLKWADLVLEACTPAIVRQLLKPGPTPVFGAPKNGQARTAALSPYLVALLHKHKAHQAALKLASGFLYQEEGLVFAKKHPLAFG